MEIVVFHSDIARLVLGYLKNQKLEKASRIFCRTSPHLRQEYTAFKQGLQAHSFFPELEEIIREYVQIARKVEQIMTTLSEVLRSNIHQKRLSEKLNALLDLLPSVAKQVNNDGDVCNKTECCKHTGSGNNVQLDKENRVKKQRSGRKRKRTSESFDNSSNERLGKINSLTGTPKKRQRVVEPLCYLSVTRPKLLHTNLCSSTSSNDPQLTTENNDQSHDDTTDSLGQEEEEEKVDSDNDLTAEDEVEVEENEIPKARAVKNKDMSMLEKPRNESTPRTKPGSAKIVTPSLLEFSQAILDNPGFQEKLVHNINQALQTSENTTTNALTNESKDETKEATRKTRSASVNLQEAGGGEAADIDQLVPVITPSQLLDQMVKEILANTEKDPTFDAIIEEVVEGYSNKSQVSTGVQCNIDSNTKNVQQLGYSALGSSHDMFSTNSSVTPSTPVVIRTAAASATSINGDPQALPSITANSSFGSLIDPNFSISKLIVLNASESAQKQSPETTSLGDTSADDIINQLTSTSAESATNPPTIIDQVYFDTTNGQLTLPFFLTTDGLLANFPFLINNELITQQLQIDNIANVESSRIEIPLPEPIVFSADQLPPNSIILSSSSQKIDTEQVLQRTVSKASKEVPTAVPASLDSRATVDRATPSASGIVNTKAFKSLSTPRKRASHVRTLTFSPRSTLTSNATPLSRREGISKFQRLQNLIPSSVTENEKENTESQAHADDAGASEAVVISNEILSSVAVPAVDTSATESSNSGIVPPLFANEDSSNQTIIKSNLQSNSLPGKSINQERGETPRRKQLRQSAVRACKRVLSKTAVEEELLAEEELPAVDKLDDEETLQLRQLQIKSADKCSEQSEEAKQEDNKEKTQKDEMMEEWVRMRRTNTSDLDLRLREWNAKIIDKIPIITKRGRKKLGKPVLKPNKKPANRPTKAQKKKSAIKEKSEASEMLPETVEKVNKKIKIRTKSSVKSKKEKENEGEKEKENDKEKEKENDKEKDRDKHSDADDADLSFLEQSHDTSFLNSSVTQTISPPTQCGKIEREKRTANIACLLETPFKDNTSNSSVTASLVPPTPGVCGTTFETPLAKVKPSNDARTCTAYLFGSLTKSELETPVLSAVTPGGFRFTPFGSKDATPRSGNATEYSSGGSYYRPDESEDLDHKLDKVLRDSAHKKSAIVERSPEKLDKEYNEFEIKPADESDNNKCLEIPAEKLKVEPIVLKRVQSFGNDAVDSNNEKIDPHYTLAAGLPEIGEIESLSSSSSSSSSPSSSSSHSSSSSSTINSSASSKKSAKSGNSLRPEPFVGHKTPKEIATLDDLSEISSTEDEEWQKKVVVDEQNSQLINNDGEVRYPVRSWLTPNKATATNKNAPQHVPATIKVTLPLKVTNKNKNPQLCDLEEKRLRMQQKLRIDSQHKERVIQPTVIGGSTNSTAAASRRLKLENDTKAKKSLPLQKSQKALNLSAKKQPPAAKVETVVPSKLPSLGDFDDNAVSNVFDSVREVNQKSTETTFNAKKNRSTAATAPIIKLPSIIKSKATIKMDRKCIQTEPHSITTTRVKANTIKKKSLASKKPTIKAVVSPTTKPSPFPKIKIKAFVHNPSSKKMKPKTTTQSKNSTMKTNTKKHAMEDQFVETKAPPSSRQLKSPPMKSSDKTPAITRKQKTPEQLNIISESKAGDELFTDFETKTVATEVITDSELKAVRNAEEGEHLNSFSRKQELNLKMDHFNEQGIVESALTPSNATASVPVTSHSKQPQRTDDDDDVDDDEASEENDPMDGCVLTSCTDNDNNFILLKYNEASGAKDMKTSPPIIDHNLVNYRMVIDLDEDEQFTLQVSDEYCLFECEPSKVQSTKAATIRNIPKKRKVRISSVTTTKATSYSKETKASVSAAAKTDAPCEIPNSAAAPAKENSTSSSAVTSLNSDAAAAAAEKIQIEDIESILSHLHGT